MDKEQRAVCSDGLVAEVAVLLKLGLSPSSVEAADGGGPGGIKFAFLAAKRGAGGFCPVQRPTFGSDAIYLHFPDIIPPHRSLYYPASYHIADLPDPENRPTTCAFVHMHIRACVRMRLAIAADPDHQRHIALARHVFPISCFPICMGLP